MTLSELIAKLQAVEAEHGDLPVIVYSLGNEERSPQVRIKAAKWRQDSADPRCAAVALN